MGKPKLFKIAAVQAAPVFLDLDATIEKACGLISQAAAQGADLVVFPETFVSGYPVWVWYIPAGQTNALREVYNGLHASAISIPGPATKRLSEAAADLGVTVAIGVNEKNSEGSNSTLYNTVLYLAPDGRILGKHRKLIPTSGERLVWAQGDGSDLAVYELPFGNLGGLICWENYMPLARYALSAWGQQIHVAPTWDHGEPWISSMRHIGKELRCFVVGCCQALHMDDIPDDMAFKKEYLGEVEGWLNPGRSLIVDPDGKIVAGPLEEKEGIIYAEVQPGQLIGPRCQLDIAGHYGRPDVFDLRFHRRAHPFIRTIEEDDDGEELI